MKKSILVLALVSLLITSQASAFYSDHFECDTSQLSFYQKGLQLLVSANKGNEEQIQILMNPGVKNQVNGYFWQKDEGEDFQMTPLCMAHPKTIPFLMKKSGNASLPINHPILKSVLAFQLYLRATDRGNRIPAETMENLKLLVKNGKHKPLTPENIKVSYEQAFEYLEKNKWKSSYLSTAYDIASDLLKYSLLGKVK